MDDSLRDFYRSSYFSSRLPYAHQFTPSGKVAGAIYAISSIKDALPILHGPTGCGFHYRYLCRRIGRPAYDLQCTGLEEQDIVMRGARKLRQTILEAAVKYHPALMAVNPGCCCRYDS